MPDFFLDDGVLHTKTKLHEPRGKVATRQRGFGKLPLYLSF